MNNFTLFAQTSSSTTMTTMSPEDAAGATVLIAGVGIVMIIIWLVMIGVFIAGFVLWLISLIHVLQHQDVKDRTMWILVILLAGTIGGVIYFFSVKKHYDRGGMREMPSIQPIHPPQN